MSKTIEQKHWLETEPRGRLLRPSEVTTITGLSKSQIYQMIRDGEFPPFIKLGKRASALPESWLHAFVADCASERREAALACPHRVVRFDC